MDNMKRQEPLIYALVALTLDMAGQTHALVADVLAELDLTAALANALWQLDPKTDAPPMRELAARLGCDPSTVTFLADRLEEKSLIKREINPSNRRVKTLILTPKGCETRQRLVEAMSTHSPVARLSAEEQQQLHGLLSKAMSTEGRRNE